MDSLQQEKWSVHLLLLLQQQHSYRGRMSFCAKKSEKKAKIEKKSEKDPYVLEVLREVCG
jgi:hypothetical protein